jgi:hypothetical protein
MSTYVEVLVPAQPLAPRLAAWLGQSIDAARAFRRALALRAGRRRQVRDAIALRHLAQQLESSMPSMAADLRRAVDGAL